MVVNALRDALEGVDFDFLPSDVESNPETAGFIVENGFFLRFVNEESRSVAVPIATGVGSVSSYQLFDYEPLAQPAAPTAAPQPEPVPAAAPAAPAATGAGKAVKSPLPGVIIAVNVKPGDTVKAGQVVAVLEAMKMENDINAPADGTITYVVKKGDNVDTGAVLAYIK